MGKERKRRKEEGREEGRVAQYSGEAGDHMEEVLPLLGIRGSDARKYK